MRAAHPGPPELAAPGTTALETIPQRILAWVDQRPTAVAIREKEQAVTYAQLWERSGSVAAGLRSRGVTEADTVLVALEPGIESAVVMLGALRCATAVAAIDPRWPTERQQTISRRLRPSLSVGVAEGEVAPTELTSAGTVPADCFLGARTADAVATIFFTSGTTGEPKMVPSPHRALTRLTGAGRTLFAKPGAVMLQASRPGWDVLSLEIWAPLCAGGTVHVLPGGLLPDTLKSAVAAGVSHAWITSSVLNLLLDEDPGCLAGLDTLYTGGEALSSRHIERFLDTHPACTLINGYGPVENCVFATTHTVTRDDIGDIPIGRPVSGTIVALVPDGTAPDQVRPGGSEGEIWLSGSGLAAGYLGDEGNQDRFVAVTPVLPGPVADDGTAQLWYRTGDYAVRGADGMLRFRGRLDRQVKIRGTRIQPEELEVHAVRLLHAACRAVPVPGRWSGYDQLALFVSSSTDAVDASEVRQQLAAVLPKHLVPDIVRHVARLPVTGNGKVDDKSLLSMLRPVAVT